MVWRRRRRKSKMKVVLLFVKTNWKSKLRQTRSLPYNPACLHWLKQWERGMLLHCTGCVFGRARHSATTSIPMLVHASLWNSLPARRFEAKQRNNPAAKRGVVVSCSHNRTTWKRNRKQKNTLSLQACAFLCFQPLLKRFQQCLSIPCSLESQWVQDDLTKLFFFVAMKTLIAGYEFLSKRLLHRAGCCVSEEETISLRCRREGAKNASKSLVPLPSGWTARLGELGCLLWVGFNLWVDLSLLGCLVERGVTYTPDFFHVFPTWIPHTLKPFHTRTLLWRRLKFQLSLKVFRLRFSFSGFNRSFGHPANGPHTSSKIR